MVIAVHTEITSNDGSEENSNFTYEVFKRIIVSHPEHTFVLISEKKLNDSFTAVNNIIQVNSSLQKKNIVQKYTWYTIKLPSILKKYKADIFVSNGGLGLLTTKIPQCMIMQDFDFVEKPYLFKKSQLLFFKTFISRSIKKAKTIITVSQYCKAAISKQFKIDTDKIEVVEKGINERQQNISYDREQIKAEYAGGNEYFIYTGAIGTHKNLFNLLKAFSAFKKRQKSGMQLFIAGWQSYNYKKFCEDLRLFKFKDDVKLFMDSSFEEIEKLTVASYAMIYPSKYECFATQPLKAMQIGVPVIVASNGAMPEMLGNIALYADPDNFKEIAVKMMLLFKNEILRNDLIEKGKLHAQKYNWNITAEEVWRGIERSLV